MTRGEGAAGPDGGQLAGVADEDELGAGVVDVVEEAAQVRVGGHAGFVEHHEGLAVEGEALVVELPQQ